MSLMYELLEKRHLPACQAIVEVTQSYVSVLIIAVVHLTDRFLHLRPRTSGDQRRSVSVQHPTVSLLFML